MTDCGCTNFPASLGNVTFSASVGIGTTTPGALLSLGGAVQTNKLYLYEAGGTVYGLGIAPNTLQIYSSSAITTAVAFGTSDGTTFSEGMRLQAGKLGVGTTTPGAQLEVVGTAGVRVVDAAAPNTGTGSLVFGNYPDPKYLYAPTDGTLQWRTHAAAGGHSFELYDKASATVKTHLDVSGASYFTGGNVGIGTNNPTELLHLQGGSLYINGGGILVSGDVSTGVGAFYATTTKIADSAGCYYAD